MDQQDGNARKTTVKKIYFYVASLVTLGIVVGSLIYLLGLGLRTWVFTEAEYSWSRAGYSPELFLENPTTGAPDEISCEAGECSLTDTQRQQLATWQESYSQWQEQKIDPNADRLQDAIGGFSFFIIALPIFLIHFREVRRDRKHDSTLLIHQIYYYLISFAALLMIVISAGVLVNTGLKAWVFPSAGEYERTEKVASPRALPGTQSTAEQLVDCADACALDSATVTLLQDYQSQQARTETIDTLQRNAAAALPFFLVGVPLFWYHWQRIRQVRKDKQGEK